MKKHLACVIVSISLATACGGGADGGSPEPEAAAPVDCAALNGLQLAAESIKLPTTGAEVISAEQTVTTTDGATLPDPYCSVKAAIHPVDPDAPDITLSVALPQNWSNTALMFGGGGYDGTVPNVTGQVAFGDPATPTPLARGYATFASDSGHTSSNPTLPTPTLDGSFGTNDEAVRNFAGDALKKTRDTAMEIIHTRYGAAPEISYFAGGSSGGREGLAVAQRWPTDFNGVIAAYPAWKAASLDLWFGYASSLLSRPGAFISPPQQQRVHDAVMAVCDGEDGLEDGVISDEGGCDFDPNQLSCDTAGADTQLCLSAIQIDTLVALSEPLKWEYPLESGETGMPGVPLLSGAKMTTPLIGFGSEAPASPMPTTSGYGAQFWDQWIRHFVTRDPNYNSLTVDPLNPGPWQQRISELSKLQDVNNTDLTEFADAGGKLFLLHGSADELVSHRTSIEYFTRLQETMGTENVDAFAKFYLVPGANHANRNPNFAANWDSVAALDEWTRNDRAPKDPVVADGSRVEQPRTRPLCEYPSWPQYGGSGDPDDAASFRCVER